MCFFWSHFSLYCCMLSHPNTFYLLLCHNLQILGFLNYPFISVLWHHKQTKLPELNSSRFSWLFSSSFGFKKYRSIVIICTTLECIQEVDWLIDYGKWSLCMIKMCWNHLAHFHLFSPHQLIALECKVKTKQQ